MLLVHPIIACHMSCHLVSSPCASAIAVRRGPLETPDEGLGVPTMLAYYMDYGLAAKLHPRWRRRKTPKPPSSLGSFNYARCLVRPAPAPCIEVLSSCMPRLGLDGGSFMLESMARCQAYIAFGTTSSLFIGRSRYVPRLLFFRRGATSPGGGGGGCA